MEFIKDDEELIQMYLWGFKSIWEVQKAISNNHNEDYDLDQVYNFIECYCNKSNYLKKIDELTISPYFSNNQKKKKIKEVLKKIVLGKMSISVAAHDIGCKRDTISKYLNEIGYVQPNQYRSMPMQLLLREYCEGRITKCEAYQMMWVKPKSFNVYVKKYKEEHDL